MYYEFFFSQSDILEVPILFGHVNLKSALDWHTLSPDGMSQNRITSRG